IYNIKGQKVRELNTENCKLNIRKVTWDGKNKNNKPVSSGIYFYKLKVGDKSTIPQKMLLIK
ncbi:MAG TPA: hypothetical protein ENL20_06225, partial [Candidatus Cloacimonetes bacterium]|nr:hypothetical protein [Candidatus Cloacimonadota bacterium]